MTLQSDPVPPPSQNLFLTKSFWTQAVGMAAMIATANGVDLGLAPQDQVVIVGLITGVAAIMVRLFTKRPAHVIAPLLLIIVLSAPLTACGPLALASGPVPPPDAAATLDLRKQEICALWDSTLRTLAGFAAQGSLTRGQVTSVNAKRPYMNQFCASAEPMTANALDQAEAVLQQMVLAAAVPRPKPKPAPPA